MRLFIKLSKITALFLFLILLVNVTPASAAFTVDLKMGQTHAQVKELQQYLNKKGYTVAVFGDGSPGFETSYMGPATVEALKRFQSANGIDPTGMVNTDTRVVLNRVGFVPVSPDSVPVSVTNVPVTTTSTNNDSSFVLADLYPGMNHPQVFTLQRLLNSFGFKVAVFGDGSPGFETSYMGPATVQSLKSFQAANGVEPTGNVGIMTKIAILKNQLSQLLGLQGGSSGTTITTTGSKTATTTVKKRRGGGGGGSGGGGGGSTPTAPVTTLSASVSSINSGDDVTISWSSTDATSCTGTNFSTRDTTSGSAVVNPISDTSYSVTCTGAGGSDTKTVSVIVVSSPVVSFTVSSSSIISGSNITLTWSSTGATSCAGTNFSTSGATSGSVVVNPTVSTTYTVTCTGTGGSDSDSQTVTVSGGGGMTVLVTPSRTTGVAPLAIFFDATGTTDPNTSRPFEDLEYRWSFGDPAGGATWNYGARPGSSSKNEATGGVAAHVFETPGTYNVTLDVIGESGTESTNLAITVTDPDTVFSGTNTRCISRAGDFTGCPAGSEQVTTTDINTAVSHIASGRRILFRKGESWPDTIYMGGINGPGIIGSYGAGASPIFTGINIGSSNTSDWRVMDVDFVRPTGDLYATAVEVVHPSSRMTFLRVKSTGAGSGVDGSFISFAMNIYDTPDSINQQVEHAIVDSEITGGRYAFYGAGDKFAMLGTYLHASGDNQHVYRSFYANKTVTSNNTFAGGGDSGGWGPISLVKQHAPDQPGAYSEYLHWSDNRFAPTNVYVSLGFGSENSETDQRLRNVVVERNWFSADYNAQLSLNVASGYNYTLRNNLFVMDNYWGTGLQVQHTSTGPATAMVNIYNNTFYKSDGGSDGMDAIQIMNSISDIVIRNNLAYAPNASNPSLLSTIAGPTNVTVSNNSTDTQVRTVSPNFANATPVTIAHFDLLSGSYGRNSGYTVPVFSDLLNRVRAVGSYDMGALEAQ